MTSEWDELERRHRGSPGGSGKLVAIGVVAMFGFLAWTQYFGRDGRDEATDSASTPTEASPTPERADDPPAVAEAQGPHYQGPPLPRTGRESLVGVYECVANGQRIVSDRPCGPDAQPRTLVVDQPDPREAMRQRQSMQSPARTGAGYTGGTVPVAPTSNSGATATTSNEAACANVDRRIDLLNARMRQGYGRAEGERLRAEWHDLKQRRYALRCGR